MNVISWLEARYRRSIDKKHEKAIRRRQFNMMVDERIALGVKALAAILEVPRYVITEHMLQVGSYHILQALEDPEKREELEKHLIQMHLLGSELRDDEGILRLGG